MIYERGRQILLPETAGKSMHFSFAPFAFVVYNRGAVGLSDPELSLGSLPICVGIVHKEEGSPLVFVKSINLLAVNICSYLLACTL